VAIAYKNLWIVEDLFRTTKSILETRPIYHKCDETIRGHVFCSFLALLLKADLERRLRERDELEWAEIVRGLENLQEVEAVSSRAVGSSCAVNWWRKRTKAIRGQRRGVPATIRRGKTAGRTVGKMCWAGPLRVSVRR